VFGFGETNYGPGIRMPNVYRLISGKKREQDIYFKIRTIQARNFTIQIAVYAFFSDKFGRILTCV
jgi:hypothetical protein